MIILDNASFHKKQEILDEIREEMPNIILEFLLPYSPDYNLMELVLAVRFSLITSDASSKVLSYRFTG